MLAPPLPDINRIPGRAGSFGDALGELLLGVGGGSNSPVARKTNSLVAATAVPKPLTKKSSSRPARMSGILRATTGKPFPAPRKRYSSVITTPTRPAG
jgi:hypothetical protein